MIGYEKWCGKKINLAAVCPFHVVEADANVRILINHHPVGYAHAYNGKI